MKTIYFANHAQFEGRYTNLGDWAIFEEMVSEITPYIKSQQCRVVVASSEPEFTSNNYPVISFQRGGRKGILNTLKWLWKSDVVVIGGGEIVQDLSSMVYIPYQLMRPFIGKLFGKKLFAYAIGIGEKEEISRIGKWQSRLVLNMFDTITVRDEKSYKILREYLKVTKPKIILTADPALNLKKQPLKNEDSSQRPYAVMSVRSVYHRNRNLLPFSVRKKLGLVPKKYYSAIHDFKSQMAEVAEYIIKEYQLDVHFLNTYTGKSMSAGDDKFSNDVISRINKTYAECVHVIEPSLKPAQVKTVLSQAKIIVSVPLHPLILGTSEGVPCISLAYASKSWCFMRQIGLQKYIHKVMYLENKVNNIQLKRDIDEIFANYDGIVCDLENKVKTAKTAEKANMSHLLKLAGIHEVT